MGLERGFAALMREVYAQPGSIQAGSSGWLGVVDAAFVEGDG
jgi:hypothetical protein